MFAKIYGVSIISPALSLLMKHLVIGQRQKVPDFADFHWSSHGSLIFIGQNSLPRGSTFSEKYRYKLNYRIGPNHRIVSVCSGRA